VALGSNVQICVNPTALEVLFTPGGTTTWGADTAYHQILGSGPGGNMQFTMGTSANFVIGQIYDINLGPRRITLDIHNQAMMSTATQGLALAIMIEVAVFVLAYALIPDDDWRASFVMIFQVATQVLLAVIMDVQGLYNQMEQSAQSIFNDAFTSKVDPPNKGPHESAKPDFPTSMSQGAIASLTPYAYSILGILEGMGIVFMVLLPVILEIVGEVRLHKPSPSQDVVDSSGKTIGTVKDNSPTGYDTF